MWPIGWRVTTEVRSVEASGDRNYLAHVHGFECEVIVTVAPFDEDVIVVGVNPYPEILLTAEGVVYVIELYCGVLVLVSLFLKRSYPHYCNLETDVAEKLLDTIPEAAALFMAPQGYIYETQYSEIRKDLPPDVDNCPPPSVGMALNDMVVNRQRFVIFNEGFLVKAKEMADKKVVEAEKKKNKQAEVK
jgi:hypothetical protein